MINVLQIIETHCDGDTVFSCRVVRLPHIAQELEGLQAFIVLRFRTVLTGITLIPCSIQSWCPSSPHLCTTTVTDRLATFIVNLSRVGVEVGTIRVSLFGGFRVQSNGADLTGHYPPKVQELFCYLLLYRDKVHARESLASVLWEHGSVLQSKKCLRQTLWRLQTSLDLHTAPNPTLRSEPDDIELNLGSSISLDVADFERACISVRGVPERELEGSQAQALADAVDLYRGDLLEGWYHDWTLYERVRLQNDYLSMLDKLMGYCQAHREYEAGLAYGATSLRHDRARERTHRRLMRLYYLAGDRTGALRQYDSCVKALNEGLGVEPSKRTNLLYRQIRTDNLASQQPAEAEGHAPEPLSSLPGALQRLRHHLRTLDELQQQVKHTILAVEALLSQRTK